VFCLSRHARVEERARAVFCLSRHARVAERARAVFCLDCLSGHARVRVSVLLQARLIIDLRERQHKWDEDTAAAAGSGAAGGEFSRHFLLQPATRSSCITHCSPFDCCRAGRLQPFLLLAVVAQAWPAPDPLAVVGLWLLVFNQGASIKAPTEL